MPFETTSSSTAAMAKMKQALSKLETEEGRKAGLSLQPKPGDIMIVTPPKCGTTLICAIVHALRSGGDENFEEINLEIPCLEMAYDYGYTDIEAAQRYSPRVFKTHSWYHHCPKGAGVKYIFTVRDPLDAGPSFYHFFSGWFLDPNEIGIDEFILEFMTKRGAPESNMQNASQWHNMASWYPYRRDSSVLWLFYEDIIADLPAAVDQIAAFLQIGHENTALKAQVVEQSSIEYMKQHPTKYDEHMLKEARNEICGLSPRAGLHGRSSGKVREGGAGKGRLMLGPETVAAMERKWEEVMLPATGYKSYSEFRQGVNAELGRKTL